MASNLNPQLGILLAEAFQHIVETGRLVNPAKWSSADAIAKLLEEAGELSEAAQVRVGKLDKELAEDADIEECADTIMCAFDVLSQANRNRDGDELILEVAKAIIKKMPKWQKHIYKKQYNLYDE